MKLRQLIGLGVVFLLAATGLAAPQASTTTEATGGGSSAASLSVPRLIKFSGTMTDLTGKPLTGPVDLNFAIYKDRNDAAPLWQESQTLNLDEQGRYTALLGAMQPEGLPIELFSAGEARWLGVGAGNLPEQPRTLLVSVPYALKAGDAETLGGKPASAYLLAQPEQTLGLETSQPASQPTAGEAPTLSNAKPRKASGSPKPQTTTTQIQFYVPVFADSSGSLTDSVIYQSGSNIGIGTKSPSQALEVNGNIALTPANSVVTGVTGLTLQETGDLYGTVALSLQNRTGVNGAMFQQAGAVDLVDEVFKGLTFQRNLRYENRNQFVFAGAPEFQIGIPGNPTLVVSDSTSAFLKGNVGIGTTTPAATLDVAGSVNSRGTVTAATGAAFAVLGQTNSNGAQAITGLATATSGNTRGVYGEVSSPNGVAGWFTNDNGGTALKVDAAHMLLLSVDSNLGANIQGPLNVNFASGTQMFHVDSTNGMTVNDASGTQMFHVDSTDMTVNDASGTVMFRVDSTNGLTFVGQFCESLEPQGSCIFSVDPTNGVTIALDPLHATGSARIDGTFHSGSATIDGSLEVGDVTVNGSLSVSGTKNFKIDDPLDPDHKFLYHASVESSEMMNMYTGNITTDTHGDAVVELPAWFQALNCDFRYQLTVIGQFAEAIVAQEIENNRFAIKTDKANVKVSWQVTGIRQDAFAKTHRMQVEEEKPQAEKGFYLHPELFAQPKEKGIEWAHRPQQMRQPESASNPSADGPKPAGGGVR